mmetsp:Transcript_18515/g.46587  ORF Transcript_18515/g.46587 Transcript_18515/m.46587 type:complete len:153 (+) Transcript_18515:1048-1506(+)
MMLNCRVSCVFAFCLFCFFVCFACVCIAFQPLPFLLCVCLTHTSVFLPCEGTKDKIPGPGSYIPLRTWPSKEAGEDNEAEPGMKRTGLMRMKDNSPKKETMRKSEVEEMEGEIEPSPRSARPQGEGSVASVTVRAGSKETLEVLEEIARQEL